MSRTVLWHERAEEDFVSQLRYLRASSEEAAKRFVQAIDETCELLCESPEIGTLLSPSLNVRALSIRKFSNHVLFYRATDRHLEVVRVFHGAQNWDELVATSGFWD
jgi:plasmid stabilization system protein ParE